MKNTILTQASFEKTADVLYDGAYFGKKDTNLGVSEKIILGGLTSIGTGCFKLMHSIPKKPKSKGTGSLESGKSLFEQLFD